jgi:hypothetical protein
MHNQAEKAINKVLPRPGLMGQTALDEVSINLGKCHADCLYCDKRESGAKRPKGNTGRA